MNQRIAKKLTKDQERWCRARRTTTNNAIRAIARQARRARRNGTVPTAEQAHRNLRKLNLLPPAVMNHSAGGDYPMPGIGRVGFADAATRLPCVLMDDGYNGKEQHEGMLASLRRHFKHLKITEEGYWEPMPWLDHTGESHNFLNIKSEMR